MAKQTYFTRYLLLIKRLKKSPASFEQIKAYLQQESELRAIHYALEKRTFHRECREIREQFGIDIRYDKKKRAYCIGEENSREGEQSYRLLEAYEMVELIKEAGQQSSYVLFERRKAGGLHHFHDLLQAIKNHQVIRITYQKFYEQAPCLRTVHPLALKESRGRWYLVAEDTRDSYIKSYGLDRISELEVRGQYFESKEVNVGALFEQAFGIIRGDKAERVQLSFTPTEGKYIKTFELHTSQKVVKDDAEAFVIELTLFITHDFMMELLSYGSEVKVLSPLCLAECIKNAHLKAAARYK